MQWVVETAEAIAEAGYPVVGCSTMFDQTNASLALLREVKRRRPETITIIGGANCAGSLSRGIIGLDPMSEAWDYIFDGEAEITFPRFLADLKAGRRPTQRVIGGAPCLDLDSLPPPGYDDYLEQHAAFVGGAASIFPQRDIQYETSRGCYRHLAGRCHFCGLNGEERRFRLRAPETVVKDVAGLHEKYPDSAIFLADTIVPDRNLGALADVPSGARLFGQVASRTSAQRAVQFQQAGFFAVLPGFESLDTTQLRAMGKGTRAADNVNAMRRLWSAGVTAFWNLLWGFPDEDPGAYRRMAAVIDRIHHLPPPRSAFHVYVTRDSSFRTDPARFGIRSVSPLAAYDDIFPEGTDTRDLAMVFTGDYDSPTYKAADELLFFLDAVDRWRAHWNPGPPPALALAPFGDLVLLMDTRGLPRSRPVRVFTLEDARLLMQPRQLDDNPVALAAVEDGLALALDGEYVPLAVAKPELLDALGVVDAVPVQSLV
jgi:ribosomal peptide maturation radical SAM protein 1